MLLRFDDYRAKLQQPLPNAEGPGEFQVLPFINRICAHVDTVDWPIYTEGQDWSTRPGPSVFPEQPPMLATWLRETCFGQGDDGDDRVLLCAARLTTTQSPSRDPAFVCVESWVQGRHFGSRSSA